MNVELHPFTNGEHNSEGVSTLDRDITPLTYHVFLIEFGRLMVACKQSTTQSVRIQKPMFY